MDNSTKITVNIDLTREELNTIARQLKELFEPACNKFYIENNYKCKGCPMIDTCNFIYNLNKI